RLGLKWPNDVVVTGAGKVAGILCEAVSGADEGFVVVGIGVNVNQGPEDFPPDVRPTATSLYAVTGRKISRAALCGAILEALREAADHYAAPLDAEELKAIADRDVLLGRDVAIDGVPRGAAAGITPEGALLVRDPTGARNPVYSGTVRVLSPGDPGSRERYP